MIEKPNKNARISSGGITMSLAFYAIGVTTVMYFISGYSCARQKDWSHAGMWVSYAFANLCLMLYEFQKNTK